MPVNTVLSRVPRDARQSAPASTTARASGAGRQLHPDLHVHPHQRAAAGPRPTTCQLGRQRRHVQLGATSISLPKNEPATLTVAVQPVRAPGLTRRSCNLDDPATPGIDYQTMNTVVVPVRSSAAAELLGHDSTRHRRPQPGPVSYFFARAGRHPGVQGGLQRTGRRRGYRPDPVPAVPPVRRRHRRATRRRTATTRRAGRSAAPAAARLSRTTTQPAARACGRSTVEARRTSDVDVRAVHADGVDPGRDASARTRTSIASATARRPGRPVSYTLTNQFGPFTGRAVGTTLGSANDQHGRRSPTSPSSSSRSRSRRARRRCARRSATRPTRPPTSTCSCSTARPGRACSPGRPRTATPRSR